MIPFISEMVVVIYRSIYDIIMISYRTKEFHRDGIDGDSASIWIQSKTAQLFGENGVMV